MLSWLKNVDWEGVFVVVVLSVMSVFFVVGTTCVVGHLVYESNRHGIITCIGNDGQMAVLPFEGGMWVSNGTFSFYTPKMEADMRINMDCVVVYEDGEE